MLTSLLQQIEHDDTLSLYSVLTVELYVSPNCMFFHFPQLPVYIYEICHFHVALK